MHRSTLFAAGILAGTLALGAGSAWAGTDTVKDARGDAGRAADITRVTVHNAGKALLIQTKLAKASSGRTHVVATLTPAAEAAPTFVARTVETGHGHRVAATLESVAPAPVLDPTDPTTDPGTAAGATLVDCRGLHASVSAGRNGQVMIRIPQVCLGEAAGTLTVAVTTATAAGEVADETPTDVTVRQG